MKILLLIVETISEALYLLGYQAGPASGLCSRPAGRDPSVHGAVLPALHLLPPARSQEGHPQGQDELSLL